MTQVRQLNAQLPSSVSFPLLRELEERRREFQGPLSAAPSWCGKPGNKLTGE